MLYFLTYCFNYNLKLGYRKKFVKAMIIAKPPVECLRK